MKGKTLKIICVGKLKAPFWREAAAHYIRLIGKWRQVDLIEIKDGKGNDRVKKEGDIILDQLLPRDAAIGLCENGRLFTSRQFADYLSENDEKSAGHIAFVIGGPFGLSDSVLARCGSRLSLSPMTWPHELARVLLLEQLYRAESILHNAAYHY